MAKRGLEVALHKYTAFSPILDSTDGIANGGIGYCSVLLQNAAIYGGITGYGIQQVVYTLLTPIGLVRQAQR